MAKSLYNKSTRELMRDMIPALGITDGKIFSRKDVQAWFTENYPKIKKGTVSAHLLRLSTNAPSRVHHNAKPGEDDLFYQMDSSHFRLYSPSNDKQPINEKSADEEIDELEEESDESVKNEFAYEKDLQNFLSKNLHLIEPGLTLYEDEGIKGIEFPVGGRFIDILAVDGNGNYVVIELKVSKGYDRVVGQLLRYTSWIKMNHADPDQNVRGIIVARNISEDLRLACYGLPEVELFEYELLIKLNKITK